MQETLGDSVQYMYQGRIQDFQIEGGTKDFVHAVHIPKSLMAEIPGSFRVLDVFLYYLSLILKHSDEKDDIKTFRGGALLLHPRWDPLLCT